MHNRRETFAKRRREVELKDRALAKQARRLAKRTEVRPIKGPPIGGFEDLPVAGGLDPALAASVAAGVARGLDPVSSTE
jgi:hypothetical protein